MNKRIQDRLNQSVRLVRIIWLLETGERIGRPDLARACGVTEKTISLDLRLLDSLGIACRYDQKRRSYVLEGPPLFPAIAFTCSELTALALAEEALTQWRGTPFESASIAAFRKIHDILPPRLNDYLSEVHQAIALHRPSRRDYTPQAPFFDSLQQAILTKRRVRLDYYSKGSDRRGERLVDPYRLYEDRGKWFLVAYCHRRQAERTFAVANIHTLTLTEESFLLPDRFTLDGYLHNSLSALRGEEVEILVRFDAEVARWARDYDWPMEHRLTEEPGGTLLLQARCSGLEGIRNELRRWSHHAEVLEPAALREMMAEDARKLLGLYEKSTMMTKKS